MADPTLPTDPHALQQMLSGEMTVAEAQAIAEQLDHDASARSAVDDLLSRDTLAVALDSTISGEMRELTAPLAEVMRTLKRSHGLSTVDPSTLLEAAKKKLPTPLPFLTPPQSPDELGRLNGYRVLRILGEGGMGLVFDAEDIKLKRHVALKVMRPEIAARAENSKRFLREAQAAATVEHDHIVPIFQVGEDNGVPFIAMPFLKGQSLADRLKQQKRPALRDVLRIGREIALGLDAAHKAGFVHRDIKPANVWLEEDRDRVKILDFGLARISGGDTPLTQDGAIVGTPSYMSPEQVRGKDVDQRADLFSLGCVLYEMTTGRRPFTGPDTMAILCALAVETPPTPQSLDSQIPSALSSLVMKLLAKEPADRPSSANAVAHELAVLHSAPDAKESTPSRTETQPPVCEIVLAPRRPSRRPLWVAATILLLSLGVGGWFYGTAVIRFISNEGELIVDVNDPEVAVTVRQDDLVIQRKDGNSWVVRAGPGVVEVTDRKTGETLVSRDFLVKRAGKEQLRITYRDLVDARATKDKGTDRLVYQDPGSLAAFHGDMGKTLSVRVTGSLSGAVWGTNVYTSDSTLAAAAVHVGLLKPGETGVVTVEIVAAPLSFRGSIRNGVTTQSYERYPVAYRFPDAKPGPATDTGSAADPVTLTTLVPQVGNRHTFSVTGKLDGLAWGTDVYTQDSDLSAAAVHAGLLRAGETGNVEIEFVAPPASFTASNRNGVNTYAFGPYPAAFRFPAAKPAPAAVPSTVEDASALATLTARVGEQHKFTVTGHIGFIVRVWGTDVYTQDSDLGAAAVHAGLIKDGETGTVEIEFVTPPATFSGSTRNGVSTGDWTLPWSGGAFRVLSSAPIRFSLVPPEVGKKYSFTVTGNRFGLVWGSDVYTQDSDLGAAAVHAGLLKDGEPGKVEIEFVDVPPTFTGSTRNGVTTAEWSWKWNGGAFRFSAAGPFNLMEHAFDFGKKVPVRITGAVSSLVWGTDVYSLDSDLAAAAVHAGVLRPGETKKLEVEILASPPELRASTRNGVTSLAWTKFAAGAFQFTRGTDK